MINRAVFCFEFGGESGHEVANVRLSAKSPNEEGCSSHHVETHESADSDPDA
jgi:hypothetical protein